MITLFRVDQGPSHRGIRSIGPQQANMIAVTTLEHGADRPVLRSRQEESIGKAG
jgi:hypothetical protein